MFARLPNVCAGPDPQHAFKAVFARHCLGGRGGFGKSVDNFIGNNIASLRVYQRYCFYELTQRINTAATKDSARIWHLWFATKEKERELKREVEVSRSAIADVRLQFILGKYPTGDVAKIAHDYAFDCYVCEIPDDI